MVLKLEKEPLSPISIPWQNIFSKFLTCLSLQELERVTFSMAWCIGQHEETLKMLNNRGTTIEQEMSKLQGFFFLMISIRFRAFLGLTLKIIKFLE